MSIAATAGEEVSMRNQRFMRWTFGLALLLLVGCAAGPNGLAHTPNAAGVVAGFWRGLWQGAIAPVTFLLSLFSARVHMYEVHNNGAWYDFGFLCGLMTCLGGGAPGRAARRRRGGATP
jgi:hypothetical protein